MSHVVSLKASQRDLVGKSSHVLSREGLIPAVIYGHGVENQNLVVDRRELKDAVVRMLRFAVTSVAAPSPRLEAETTA